MKNINNIFEKLNEAYLMLINTVLKKNPFWLLNKYAHGIITNKEEEKTFLKWIICLFKWKNYKFKVKFGWTIMTLRII